MSVIWGPNPVRPGVTFAEALQALGAGRERAAEAEARGAAAFGQGIETGLAGIGGGFAGMGRGRLAREEMDRREKMDRERNAIEVLKANLDSKHWQDMFDARMAEVRQQREHDIQAGASLGQWDVDYSYPPESEPEVSRLKQARTAVLTGPWLDGEKEQALQMIDAKLAAIPGREMIRVPKKPLTPQEEFDQKTFQLDPTGPRYQRAPGRNGQEGGYELVPGQSGVMRDHAGVEHAYIVDNGGRIEWTPTEKTAAGAKPLSVEEFSKLYDAERVSLSVGADANGRPTVRTPTDAEIRASVQRKLNAYSELVGGKQGTPQQPSPTSQPADGSAPTTQPAAPKPQRRAIENPTKPLGTITTDREAQGELMGIIDWAQSQGMTYETLPGPVKARYDELKKKVGR